MSVRKSVVLAAAGMVSLGVFSASLAGGPDVASSAPNYSGIYLEGNLGYAYRSWKADGTTDIGILDSLGKLASSSNASGGFAFGADAGYQFNQYFSAEGGWYYLPKVKATSSQPTINYSIKSGLAYAAVKGMAPIYENTYVFSKVGIAYVYGSSNGPMNSMNSETDHSRFWSPLFAAGVQYNFTPNWSVNAQYLFVSGYHGTSSKRFFTPNTHLFTVGVGYKFLM